MIIVIRGVRSSAVMYPIGKEEMGHWLGHIDTFFNELPHEIIIGFIKENGISYNELKKKYDMLPKVMKGRNFERIIHE